MGIAKEISRGLKHLERALDGPSFNWNGNDYPCSFASTTEGKVFGVGGLASVDTGILYVRLAVLGDAVPQSKDSITVDGKVFRIDTIDTLPGKPALRITYNDPNRGS